MISKAPSPGLFLASFLTVVLGACSEDGAGNPIGAGGQGAAGSFVGGGVGSGGQSGTPTGGSAGKPVGGGWGSDGGGMATSGGANAGGANAGGAPGVGGGSAGASGGSAGGAPGGSAGEGGQPSNPGGRSIAFGTLLDAEQVMTSARALATSLAKPGSSQWRAKGDQHRTYRFADSGRDEPYRLYVPTDWDGTASLPLAMFLHGAGNDENSYVDQNSQQMLKLAQTHGYILVAPLGVRGAYGNFLRLSAPFGNEAGAAELMAAVTTESERENQLSEQDVINVLELTLSEYPIDRKSVFLFGHSMGSGGTWYIGGKYAAYFRGLAPMSGPFVQERGYPWESLRSTSLFVTEGSQTPSLEASKALAKWLTQDGFEAQYREVNADHGGMVSLVLGDVFDFFDDLRGK